MRLAEIHVYPMKGARGIACERADVLAGGLRHDRRFMLLDADGVFLTQRKLPRLALITTALRPSSLVLGIPGGADVEVPLAPTGPRRRVRVWDDDVDAIEVPGDAAERISSYLGERCTLVFMPENVARPIKAPYGAPGDHVGFADGYPVLLAARASLAELNTRLEHPVPMNRFRPNLVVEGGEAYDEDLHDHVKVGALVFRMPKRCDRCVVTTVDQATAEVSKEPLRALATYRKVANKVYFAQNLIPDAEGALAVGDEVDYFGRVAT